MCKFAKILLLATLCGLSSDIVWAPSTPTAADAQTAIAALDAATTALTTMNATIVAAGSYVYSDAVALLAPMSDITNALWVSYRKATDSTKQSAFLNALLALAASLVDNRERASKEDLMALRDALDANMDSDGYVLVVTSPFKDAALQQQLVAILKAFAKKVQKKQDFKSVVAIILNNLASAQTLETSVFDTIADMVNRRLDDDDVVTTINGDGSSTVSFEFQTEAGLNYFDAAQNGIAPSSTTTVTNSSLTAVNIFNNNLSYDNSWAALRGVVEKVVGNKLYRNYKEAIDLSSSLGTVVQGVTAYRTTLLGMLAAPITIEEIVACLDRLSSIDPFTANDVSRLMNRVRLLRTMLSKGLVKPTSATLKTIRQRMQFTLQTLLNMTNSGSNLNAHKNEIQVLLSSLGSEAFNDQIPDAGTVVALQWKNPATGLFQYVNAVQVGPVWQLQATSPDYFDDAALFYVISNADRIGFQCLKMTNGGAPGLVMQDDIAPTTATGLVKFRTLTNDPVKNLSASVNMVKATPLAQFFMEGTAAAASFKSTSFVPGVMQQSGYLSIGPDGAIRTFNPGTKSPAGVFVNNALTAGPWETFSLVQVEQFSVDLAKIRSNPDENARIDFWKNAIKQLSADTTKGAAAKRLAVINEMLRYIQNYPKRADSLADDLKKKFSDLIDFSLSSFAGQSLLENDLRIAMSKIVAEFEIPVQLDSSGNALTMPASLPVDGQSVVLFVPGLAGSLSGRYLEVIQESLDATNPSYVIRASALDPVSPSAQFKVSVFRDFLSFESLAFPGNVFQIGLADDSYKNLAQEAKIIKLRAVAKPLAKDSRGLAAGFWDDVNKNSRLEFIDVTDKDGERTYLKCASNNAYLRVENDGYLRTYDIAADKLAASSSAPLTEDPKNPGVPHKLATVFQVIPVKMLYTQLGALQKQTDELARVNGYKGLILQIETADDIQVLIDEVGDYLNEKRANQKAWGAFEANLALKNSFLEVLKSFRSSFKNALKNKALDNRLSDVEEKFVIPPVFSSQTLLKADDVIALGWQDDRGVTRYVSARDISFDAMRLNDTSGTIVDLLPFMKKTIAQLEAGNASPIDGSTHFKVVARPNSNVITLQSLSTSKNMQAVAFMNLIDIEERYGSSDYKNDKAAFDKYKSEALGVSLEGESFEQGIADERILEEFMAVETEGAISFKSASTGGFISVNPTNKRLVTLDPMTVTKAGQDRAGILVPSSREKFVVVPISAFVAKLGDILGQSDMNARFALYLYHVTGAVTDADRKVFVDAIAQEIAAITATQEAWKSYLTDSANTDARSSLMAVMNQLETDPGYQKILKDSITAAANQLDAGFTGAGVGGVPAKGSFVVLKTGGQTPKYVKVVPSAFDNTVFVLGAGTDGSNDMFDPACILVSDARSGMIGLKSSLAKNKYVRSIVLDPVDAKNWIMAKRNAQTEMVVTGSSFGSLGNFDDQLFKLIVVDQVAGTVKLQNVATQGFLSWVSGNGLPNAQQPAVVTSNSETNAVSFVPSNRLRTIDPLTLKPFGEHTVNVLSTSSTEDSYGTTFVMTVFDEYYKLLMNARSETSYQTRLATYGRALPLIKSETELQVILSELSIMVNLARADKESALWKEFSSEDVRVKYLALLELINDNFTSMLVDESNARNTYGKTLDGLKDYESSEKVATYADRFNTLSTRLNTLTPESMDAFMTDLTNFVADRTDGVVVVGSGPGQTLNMDLVVTAATWVAENVFYNKVLTQAKKRDKITALIKQANTPVTFAEYVSYIDSRWISAKDRFTTNEKTYVIKLLANLVAAPWLAYASAEDFDLAQAKDLLLRARANQMRDDAALVTQLNQLLPKLAYPLISGSVFMKLINDLIATMRETANGSVSDFSDAKKKFIAKAALWKTRVISSGPGMLDLFNYATLLNSLLQDQLLSGSIQSDLKPILMDIVTALNAQGMTFTIATGTDGSSNSNNEFSTSTPSATSNSTTAPVTVTLSSGLSI